MKFTAEDMNLNWTAWLIKNDKLISDVEDGVFETPYLFMSDVVATGPGGGTANVTNGGEISVEATTPKIEESPLEGSVEAPEGTSGERSIFDIDGDDFAIVPRGFVHEKGESYTEESLDSELDWLSQRLNTTDVEILDKIIELADGTRAMAALKGDVILLWDGADVGSIYHEAFHKISLLTLTRKERLTIYDIARREMNDGKLMDASNAQVEEFFS